MEERRTALQDAPQEAFNLALDPVLDLRAAPILKEAVQKAMARRLALSLDASAVSRMSTACVQVLTAAAIEARKNASSLVLNKSSPAFDSAFVNLGLADILDSIKPQDAK